MKIGFFITARLKSSRLKQKILLDLNGKSVLDRVIERAKKVVGIDGVVLCTSTNPQDSVLFENALNNKIQFFAGSEDDVLNRLLAAAKHFGYDAFVSITADNPLFSIYTSNILVDMYRKEQYDFINTKGLPMGCGTYILDVKALEVVNHMKQQSDTEIWGPFINRPDFFNVADLMVKNSPYNENIRITLDYAEDYLLIKNIYNRYKSNDIPDLSDVLHLLQTNPELLEINKMHQQLMPSKEQLNLIDEQFNKNKEKGLIFAGTINKKIAPNYTNHKVVF
ncbi:MAG: NTP transferase domain-containing protein [Candidatus Atribacteria bacterium]|nr:NTP transferase domain-containing protein [Candidatus Atribacteria bacterium]